MKIPIFNNFLQNVPRDRPEWIILDVYVFDNFILADEWFKKSSQRLKTVISFNEDIWLKLVLLSITISFDGNVKVTVVTFFAAGSDKLTFALLN